MQSKQRKGLLSVCLTTHRVPWPCPRSVKKVTLRLIETLVDKSEDPDMVATQVRCAVAFPCRSRRCCIFPARTGAQAQTWCPR